MAVDLEWAQRANEIRKKTWVPWRSRKVPQRAILKDGHKNVIRTKLAKISRWKYLQDIFTTLMDAQWRWTVIFIGVEFFGCWLVFALIWWLIAFVHGDLREGHLPIQQPETGWTPCILNIHGFHSCFLYSLETQHTTGYGLRVITEECPEAIFILCFQCIIGTIIDSFTIGIVFAKLVRSKFASQTIQFSKNAVMSKQDGKLCFMFRIGDIRRSRLVGVGVRAILIKNERSKEGELLSNHQTELSLKADGGDSSLFLLWPLTVYHAIDENSPLYDFTVPELLKNQKIEIIVFLNATVESTGSSVEAKSSYLANEILWDRRFETMVSFNKQIDSFEIDWGKFDNTFSVNPPKKQEHDDTYGHNFNSQETAGLLDEYDAGSASSTKHNNPPYISRHPINEEEMMHFEENDAYSPLYVKPSLPVWQTTTKGDHILASKNKYDSYPSTINESDEDDEMQVSYV